MGAAPRLEPILIVSDAHIPYHDRRAFDLMLRVGRTLKPTHLIIIGDFLDFYAVSAHSKDPNRARQLEVEIGAGADALDQLDQLGAQRKVYISGNHEARLERYLADKAPELFNLVDVPSLLDLKRRGWVHVPYRKDRQLGKLHLTHDVGSAGRNAVFRCLDTYQHSVVTGHTHRLAYIVEGNALGEFKLSAQFGWLGDAKHVDYMQSAKVLKDWALGFGVGYLNPKTGYVYLTPVPIVKYTCVVNGRMYEAPLGRR
mgnify:CR=1 FL=1|jgi:predicted phosphodiesterase